MQVHNSCSCVGVSRMEWEDRFVAMGDITSMNLLSLQDMYHAGNSVESIGGTLPFRNSECGRSVRCCGQCTRQCYNRCVMDSLNRLYMWRKTFEGVAPEKVPINILMALRQTFRSAAHLSWVVGEILSGAHNEDVKEYMSSRGLRPYDNPYKMDYAPTYAIDPDTGKRIVNPDTGEIKYVSWPASGLCPFCTSPVTVDRRYGRKEGK